MFNVDFLCWASKHSNRLHFGWKIEQKHWPTSMSEMGIWARGTGSSACFSSSFRAHRRKPCKLSKNACFHIFSVYTISTHTQKKNKNNNNKQYTTHQTLYLTQTREQSFLRLGDAEIRAIFTRIKRIHWTEASALYPKSWNIDECMFSVHSMHEKCAVQHTQNAKDIITNSLPFHHELLWCLISNSVCVCVASPVGTIEQLKSENFSRIKIVSMSCFTQTACSLSLSAHVDLVSFVSSFFGSIPLFGCTYAFAFVLPDFTFGHGYLSAWAIANGKGAALRLVFFYVFFSPFFSKSSCMQSKIHWQCVHTEWFCDVRAFCHR